MRASVGEEFEVETKERERKKEKRRESSLQAKQKRTYEKLRKLS